MDAICEICRFIHHINKVTVQFLKYLCIRANFFFGKISYDIEFWFSSLDWEFLLTVSISSPMIELRKLILS
jgi:hypothetical protein